jgi:hypothetical protein
VVAVVAVVAAEQVEQATLLLQAHCKAQAAAVEFAAALVAAAVQVHLEPVAVLVAVAALPVMEPTVVLAVVLAVIPEMVVLAAHGTAVLDQLDQGEVVVEVVDRGNILQVAAVWAF